MFSKVGHSSHKTLRLQKKISQIVTPKIKKVDCTNFPSYSVIFFKKNQFFIFQEDIKSSKNSLNRTMQRQENNEVIDFPVDRYFKNRKIPKKMEKKDQPLSKSLTRETANLTFSGNFGDIVPPIAYYRTNDDILKQKIKLLPNFSKQQKLKKTKNEAQRVIQTRNQSKENSNCKRISLHKRAYSLGKKIAKQKKAQNNKSIVAFESSPSEDRLFDQLSKGAHFSKETTYLSKSQSFINPYSKLEKSKIVENEEENIAKNELLRKIKAIDFDLVSKRKPLFQTKNVNKYSAPYYEPNYEYSKKKLSKLCLPFTKPKTIFKQEYVIDDNTIGGGFGKKIDFL